MLMMSGRHFYEFQDLESCRRRSMGGTRVFYKGLLVPRTGGPVAQEP